METLDAEWRSRAACRGADTALFFPTSGDPSPEILKLCDGCPVRSECLEFGLTQLSGVWGGTGERERDAIRQRRRVQRALAELNPETFS